MKYSYKRVLAAGLTLALLLSNLPVIPFAAAAEEETVYVKLEAEDTTHAVWNGYTKVDTNEKYSGTGAAAGAPSGLYPDWDNGTAEDLSSGHIDKSNDPYVAFFVNAPETGTYTVQMSAEILPSSNLNKAGGNFYGAILVNPYDGESRQIIQAKYIGGNDYYGKVKGKVVTTQEYSVTLKAGHNVIYCFGLTDEQDYDNDVTCWSNIDCLVIGGKQAVTANPISEQVLRPADTEALHGYANRNSNGSIGGGNWTEKPAISEMGYSNVEKTKSFTFTVTAPADGYYDITAEFALQKNSADRAIGLLVDGIPQAREYDYYDGQSSKDGGKGLVDLSVYLTAGDHILTVTAPTKRTADDTCGNAFSWADFNSLTLRGGLVKADIQYSADGKYKYIQANNTDYTWVNRFDNLAASNSNATDTLNVGSGHHGDNQALTEINAFFDMEDNTYVKFLIEAPEAGEYALALRYTLNMSNISNGTEFEAGQAYATFLVNGKVITADFGGTSGNYDSWMSDTPVALTLEEGINTVIAMPLTKEQMTFGGSGTWADVDVLKIDPRLTPVKLTETVTVTPGNSDYINLYKNIGTSSVGNAIIAHAKEKALTVQGLIGTDGKADPSKLLLVPYVSYTLTAPQTGYYDLVLSFAGNLKSLTGYENKASMAMILDGTVHEANFETDASGNGKVYFNAKLEEGNNVVTFTMQMPKTAESNAWSGYWTDLKALTLTGGVKLATQQINPLTGAVDLVLEAEDAYYEGYNTVEQGSAYSGGAALGNGVYGNTASWETLKTYFDRSNTPYVLYQVEAPAEGDYAVRLQYRFKDEGTSDLTSFYSYVTFLVNGKRYRGEFMGKSGALAQSQTVMVHLNAGVNTIVCIPVTQNVLADSGNDCWANPDCLYVDSRLTAVSKDTAVTVDADDAIKNLYHNTNTQNGNLYAGTALYNIAKAEKLSVADLIGADGKVNTNNLLKVPYLSYTVTAEKDGYYDISMYFAGNFDGETGYMAYAVDGVVAAKQFKANADSTWNSYNVHSIDLSVYLTKGDHVLTVTGHLPLNAEAAATSKYGWCDMGPVTLRGGLKLAAETINPLTGAAGKDLILQAETDAFFNYFNTQNRTQTLEGATVIGDADASRTPTYIQLQSQLAAGLFDKSNLSYLGFLVEAPADGDYYIKLRYQPKDGADSEPYPFTPYAGFVINGEKLYKAEFAGPKNKLRDTVYVKVNLKQGVNAIYCIPVLKDTVDAFGTDGWVNVDYLAVDSRLTKVSPDKLSLAPDQAPFINLYTRNEGFLGGAQSASAEAQKIAIADITTENLGSVPYFSYTVNVEKSGYYDMTLRFGGKNDSTTNAFGLIVDGVPYAMSYSYKTGSNQSSKAHDADLSLWLEKGTHILTVTMQLPADAAASEGYNYEWTDLCSLTVYGKAVLATKQINPVPYVTDETVENPGPMTKIEAEDPTYVHTNLFAGTADSTVSGGDWTDKASVKELMNGLDKSNTAYAAITVEAPADGKYAIGLRGAVTMDIFDTDNKPYAVLVINDGDVYKTRMNGKNGETADSDVILVDLKAGRNTVYVVLLTTDVTKGSTTHDATLDAIYVAEDLTVVEDSTVTVKAGEGFNHLYNARSEGYLIDGDRKAIKVYRPNAADLTADDLRHIPFASYTVVAPVDGYYDISMLLSGTSETVLGGMIDGVNHPFQVTHHYDMYDEEGNQTVGWTTRGYHQVNLSAWLTAGEHTIVVTMELPKTAAAAEKFSYGWTDLGAVTLHGGLSLAEKQKNPLADGMILMEAEDYCAPNYYEGINSSWLYSGGKIVNRGGGTRQSDAALRLQLDKKEQSYIEYNVSAPAAGKYKLLLGVQIGGSKEFPEGFTPYVWLWVNGKTVKVTGENSRGSISCIPVTVSLAKGQNVIRLIGATKNMTKLGIWMDHDYLAIDSALAPLTVPKVRKVEAESAEYFNHYVANERKSASGGAIMGSSAPSAAMAGVTTKNLNPDNFEAASYLSFTVYAPRSGYYTIASRVHMDKGERYGKLGLMVDGKTHIMGMYQNKWGDQNYAEATVYLSAGTHVLVFTGLLGDSFPKLTDVLWIDYDWIELGNGLKLASEQIGPTTNTQYTRLEAETYAIGNMYQRNSVYDEMSGGYCNYSNSSPTVQSYEDLAANGISGKDTPYVKFTINAPAAGTYDVRVGMSYKHNGKTEQDYSSLAILINGEPTEVRLPRFTNNYCKPFPLNLQLTLQEGFNEVIFTGVLDDTSSEGNYVNLHYDYLDVTGGLTAQPVGQRIEAENAEYNGYITDTKKSASNKSVLAQEDWDSVWTNDLTLANLNMRTYMAMPWVRYSVVAEEDGVYEIVVGFDSEGSIDQDQVFMGMSINNGPFQEVWYNLMSKNSVVIQVELKKGDNTILLTGAPKDFLYMPNYPSQKEGYNVWIDHDYLDLAPGLSAVAKDNTPAWTGDAEADYRQSLSDVWGDLTGEGFTDNTIDDSTDPNLIGWIFGVAGLGVVLMIFVILMIVKKKKKEDKSAT